MLITPKEELNDANWRLKDCQGLWTVHTFLNNTDPDSGQYGTNRKEINEYYFDCMERKKTAYKDTKACECRKHYKYLEWLNKTSVGGREYGQQREKIDEKYMLCIAKTFKTYEKTKKWTEKKIFD